MWEARLGQLVFLFLAFVDALHVQRFLMVLDSCLCDDGGGMMLMSESMTEI